MEEEKRVNEHRIRPCNFHDNLEEEKEIDGDHDDEFSTLKEELMTYMQDSERSLANKTVLLERNNDAAFHRPAPAEITKRDSSVKKNSTFIRKLRTMGGVQMDSLLLESLSLNLSKYLSEVAAAIVETKLKFTDIPPAVLLCTELNCSYAEFSAHLQDEFIKELTINRNEPVANANRLRVELCFYAELCLCGVIPARQSLPVLGTALTVLTADKTFTTMSLILSFSKHCGPDFAGLVPRRIRLLSEQFGENLRRSTLLAPSRQENVRSLLCDYYLSLCHHLNNEQTKLTAYERQNRQILAAKGEVRPERITNLEVMRTEIQTLLSGAVTLAELLDLELPDLPDSDLQEVLLDGEDCNGGHVWEDELTRLFYTHLPDIKEYLGQMNKQDSGAEKSCVKDSEPLKYDDSDSPSKKTALDNFLKLLPDCQNKEMIDNAALEFLIYFNTKPGRKKLIIKLYSVPRKKLELLALYSRFVAILNPVMPEIGSSLCQQLKSDLLRHIHKKDQINVESKKKTVKFIGELVNFGVYEGKEALKAVKQLFYDFTHHNIDMVCSLLETCGRVLLASSLSHLTTKYYLEHMMRLKTMMTLDSRYVTLIENTYYHILPPETSCLPTPVLLTPMQQFIAQTIYQDLSQPGSEMAVMHMLRSLKWGSEEVASYTVLCLTDASKVCYLRIKALASVLSLLTDYQEGAVCQVVDGVLEDIRLGMELNEPSINQRRVAMIKYLGELYNYRLLDTSDILRVLYSLISFGVACDSLTESPFDPPNSVIRIHLVLLLLSTCAFPVSSKDTANKLKYFFIYFQDYYWTKRSSQVWTENQPFPRDIAHRFQDVLVSLCPEFVFVGSLENAKTVVNNLNNQMYCDAGDNLNIASKLGTVFEDYVTSEDEENNNNSKEWSNISNSGLNNEDESDQEFLQELNKMFTDSIKGTETNFVKPNTDIAVPLNYKKSIGEDKSQFVLLLKKGNKQTLKPVTLPSDHEFLIGLKSREEVRRQEKEQFKKLTLHINERQQEDI